MLHIVFACRRVDDNAAVRLLSRNRQERLSAALVGLQRLLLEPVGFPLAAARGGALQAYLGVDVEDQRHVRHHAIYRDALDVLDKSPRLLAAVALINARRIEEAIAKHDGTALDCRADHLLNVIGAGGCKQQRLHARTERLSGAGENDVPQSLRTGRAAGFARNQRVVAGLPQLLGEAPDLGGLTRALSALECDEQTARQPNLSPDFPNS